MSRSRLELIIEDRFGFEQALPPFETEYKFNKARRHPVTGKLRRWRFDYAWPGRMVAVEAEGGTWVQGSHTRGGRYAKDCEKYNAAALDGWIVIRWTTDAVRERWGDCMAELEEALLVGGRGAV